MRNGISDEGRTCREDKKARTHSLFPNGCIRTMFCEIPPLLIHRGRNYAIAAHEHSVRIYLLVVAALYLTIIFREQTLKFRTCPLLTYLSQV